MRKFLDALIGTVGAHAITALVGADPALAAAAVTRIITKWLDQLPRGDGPGVMRHDLPGVPGWAISRLANEYWWDLAGERGGGDQAETAAAVLIGFGIIPVALPGRQLARLGATIDALLVEAGTLGGHG